MASTTTPDAICTSVESKIAGLTPAGATLAGFADRFEVADDRQARKTWEERLDSDIDRNFTVELEFDQLSMWGNAAQRAIVATMTVQVGHAIGLVKASRNRRLKDLAGIVAQLTHPSYYNGVSGLHFILPDVGVDRDSIKNGKFWISTLTFSVRFALAANYGGS